jgi:lycopene cyclase domain-containing protein
VSHLRPYSAAAAAAVAATLATDVGLLRTRLVTRRSFWTAYGIVLGFQLLTNGLLAGGRIVVYDERRITGRRVAGAPVEDLGFGFALVTQTLAWWVWWGRLARRRSPDGTGAPAAAPAPPPRRGGAAAR